MEMETTSGVQLRLFLPPNVVHRAEVNGTILGFLEAQVTPTAEAGDQGPCSPRHCCVGFFMDTDEPIPIIPRAQPQLKTMPFLSILQISLSTRSVGLRLLHREGS